MGNSVSASDSNNTNIHEQESESECSVESTRCDPEKKGFLSKFMFLRRESRRSSTSTPKLLDPPAKGILRRRSLPAGDHPTPSTSRYCDKKRVRRRCTIGPEASTSRLRWRSDVKQESIDDGMDDIDALQMMLAKVGYFLPDELDWRRPASDLLRVQIKVRLRIDLTHHQFMQNAIEELQKLDDDIAKQRHTETMADFRARELAICPMKKQVAECPSTSNKADKASVEEKGKREREGELENAAFILEPSDIESVTYSQSSDSFQTCYEKHSDTSNESFGTDITKSTDSFSTSVMATNVTITDSCFTAAMTIISEMEAEDDEQELEAPKREQKKKWSRRVFSCFSCCHDASEATIISEMEAEDDEHELEAPKREQKDDASEATIISEMDAEDEEHELEVPKREQEDDASEANS